MSQNISAVIEQLTNAGVFVFVDDGKLKTKCSKDKLTPEVVALIKANKEALVTSLSKPATRIEEVDIVDAIERKNLSRGPLSFSQKRLWLLDQIENGSAQYNMARVLRFDGDLNFLVLQRCLTMLINRHETLRTVFNVVDGEPVQVVMPEQALSVRVKDLSDVADKEQVLSKLISDESQKVFDLSEDLMLRATLVKFAEKENYLLFTLHHIAADGWSIGLIMQELSMLYQVLVSGQNTTLPPLPIQYIDYTLWQKESLQGDKLAKHLDYWKSTLAGIPEVHGLPTDRPRPATQSFKGQALHSHISKEMTQALTQLCQSHGATLFMGLHAAFAALLHRYSNEDDIVIGTPVANREQAEAKALVGFFVNTLILRSDLSEKLSFSDLLAQSKLGIIESSEHQQTPFELLLEQLQPARSLSHSPLFQVLLVLQPIALGTISLPDVDVNFAERETKSSIYDLTLNATETPNGLDVEWEFNTDLFDESTIERMAKHFECFLANVIRTPEAIVQNVSFLEGDELKGLLQQAEKTTVAYPDDLCVYELFEKQAELTPDNIAVTFGENTFTYKQLNEKANQLAHYLLEQGVGANTLVGLCVERSEKMVVALLAIMKSGGAYVPLDPHYPQDRINYMIDDSSINHLISENTIADKFAREGMNIFNLNDLDSLSAYSSENISTEALGLDTTRLSYVIYTSGSTGNPKGVMLEHRNLTNFIYAMKDAPGCDANHVLLAVTSLSFDIHTLEMYLPLIVGASIVVASKEESANAEALISLIDKHQVNMMQATPSTWKMLVESQWMPPKTMLVLTGGEALSTTLKDNLVRHDGLTLWNLYGPTETCVYSAVYEMRHEEMVTIGLPVANTSLYVVDDEMALVPDGIAGQLLIGGSGLARGYLNRQDLTDDKFVEHSFVEGHRERLYKTGDLVRRLADGRIEYISRMDDQVKLRGFRIELGEIESLLIRSEGVHDALVQVKERKSGDKILAAYIVAPQACEQGDDELVHKFTAELRASLSGKLPEFMVPSSYTVLSKFPLTPNGKIDRKALPEPASSEGSSEYTAPSSQAEIVIAEIWQELLEVKSVSVHDNFFAIGGDSITAIRLVSHIKRLGVHLSVRDIFENSDLYALAAYVSKRWGNNDDNVSRSQGDQRLSPRQLSCLKNGDLDASQYINVVQLDVPNSLNMAFLSEWFKVTYQSHDAFNLGLSVNDENILNAQYHDLSDDDIAKNIQHLISSFSTETERQKNINTHKQSLIENMSKPNELGRFSSVFSGFFVENEAAQQENGTLGACLLLAFNSLVIDEDSIRIVLNDLYIDFEHYQTNGKIDVVRRPGGYQAYTQWLSSMAQSEPTNQQVDEWLNYLNKTPGRVAKPSENFEEDSDLLTLNIKDDVTNSLLAQKIEESYVSLEHNVLRAFGQALSAYYEDSKDDVKNIYIDIVKSARNSAAQHLELNNLVGEFTYNYPVALRDIARLEQLPNWAMKNGVNYGVLTELCQSNTTSKHYQDLAAIQPSDIVFQYHGSIDPLYSPSGFSCSSSFVNLRNITSALGKYSLICDAALVEGSLKLVLRYDHRIYSREIIQGLLTSLETLLENVHTQHITAQAKIAHASDVRYVPMAPTVRYLLKDQNWRTHFNVSFMMGFHEKNFNMPLIERCFNQLIDRHDGLRFRIHQEGNSFTQYVAPQGLSYQMKTIDLSSLDDVSGLTAFDEEVNKLQKSFVFDKNSPLFYLVNIKLNNNLGNRLLLLFHHLIVDGTSIRAIVKELYMDYSLSLTQTNFALPSSSSSHWLTSYYEGFNREKEQELEYWKRFSWDQLAKVKHLKPADYHKQCLDSFSVYSQQILSDEEVIRLTSICAEDGSSLLYEAIILGFYQALSSTLTSPYVMMELVNDNRGGASFGADASAIVGNVTSNDFMAFDFSNENKQPLNEMLKSLRNQRMGFKGREKSLMTMLYGEDYSLLDTTVNESLPAVGLNFIIDEKDRTASLKQDMPSYIWPAEESAGAFESRDLEGVRTHALFIAVVLVQGEGLTVKAGLDQSRMINEYSEKVLNDYGLALKNMVSSLQSDNTNHSEEESALSS